MSRRAIVTGATSGIGRALVIKLVQEGYRVGAAGRREDRLIELKATSPDQIEIASFDISEREIVAEQLRGLVDRLGGLDLFVANAGIGRRNPDLMLQPELETLDVNVIGFINSVIFAAQYFLQQGRGHIVGISSVAAFWGNKNNPAYNASKAFEMNYFRGLHANLISRDICVTDIRPGFVQTEMTENNPRMFWVASSEKAAHQIYNAIRNKQKIAYVSRRWRYVSWLMRMIPDTLYRRFT